MLLEGMLQMKGLRSDRHREMWLTLASHVPSKLIHIPVRSNPLSAGH